nr:hypothetical protein [Kibdelosporangium sp. MJ126-NF4]CTQ97311.1 hypothetical protein [Kibdelosporangium sp. MJ126-NF4]
MHYSRFRHAGNRGSLMIVAAMAVRVTSAAIVPVPVVVDFLRGV